MFKRQIVIATGLLCAMSSGAVAADIVVQIRDRFDQIDETRYPSDHTDPITINNIIDVDELPDGPFVTVRINVYNELGASGNLPKIMIPNGGNNIIPLILGTGNPVLSMLPLEIACNDFAGLEVIARQGIALYGRVAGNLVSSNPSDRVQSPRIEYFRVDGQVNMDILNSQRNGFNRYSIGTLLANKTIDSNGTGINLFECFGDLNGHLVTSGGSVSGGAIHGSVGTSATIESSNFRDMDILGDMLGTINCGVWERSTIAGDLGGTINIGSNAGLPATLGHVVRIGGSFLNGAKITIKNQGLHNWIMINEQNNGGVWQPGAEVIFGNPLSPNLVLSGPGYSATPVDIGGGAIGDAPFALHGSGCSPTLGINVGESEDLPLEIEMRHYGLVAFKGGDASGRTPYKVSRRSIFDPLNPGPWVDHTGSFTFSRKQLPFPQSSLWSYSITADPSGNYAFVDRHEYKVELETSPADPLDRLVCFEVAGEPDVEVYSTLYSFTIDNNCAADLNRDNFVDTADLGILLGNFGLTGDGPRGDINGDGVVDTADLGILLGTFGQCPIGGGESAMADGGGGPTVSPLLAEMGFDSVDAYIAWLDTLSERKLTRHIGRMLEWISEN